MEILHNLEIERKSYEIFPLYNLINSISITAKKDPLIKVKSENSNTLFKQKEQPCISCPFTKS